MKFSIKVFKAGFLGMGFLVYLMSCKAQVVQSTDFTPKLSFTSGIEGPAVDKDGNLYAVNFREEGTVGIVDQNGKGKLYFTLPEGSIGNGIRFDLEGNMYVADYKGHNVYQVRKGTNKPMVWAHNPDMNQPNDLAISPNGILYLSDPNWAESTGKIWMVDKSAKIVLLDENMGTTNGIEVSPDGKNLYVNESVQLKVWKYDILEDGKISGKTEFLSLTDYGMDGMRCDNKGNLYITRYGKGTVLIVSPQGKTLREVRLNGKKPSNITFGGNDGKTCFVTLQDRGCFEQFRALHPGAFYTKVHKENQRK